jgi:hypothetical protein
MSMKRLRIAALSTTVTLAAGIAVAIAGTPFGGDDTGTIPSDAPNGPVTKCEVKLGKGVSKLAANILKCHALEASGKLANDAAEDACEATAINNFETHPPFPKPTGCPLGCLGLGTAAAVVSSADNENALVYCTGAGTPFGGDDTGNIPSDAPNGPLTKCANGVNKAVGKLIKTVLKCTAAVVRGKFSDDEACESAALTKFGTTNITGCDPCVSLSSIGATIENMVDSANSTIYCGSPSAAFLDAE